jgi:hypothetical protein
MDDDDSEIPSEVDRAAAGLLALIYRDGAALLESEDARAAFGVLVGDLTRGETAFSLQVNTGEPGAVAWAVNQAWNDGMAQARDRFMTSTTALLGNFARFCQLLEEHHPELPVAGLLQQVALEAAVREADPQ